MDFAESEWQRLGVEPTRADHEAARVMEVANQVAVGGASVIDRHRALQHFGSEGVMHSLLQRFPETVRGTLCRLRAAWLEGRDEDLRCHIYQIRGAASWVCADRLLGATEELMRAYQERKCCAAAMWDKAGMASRPTRPKRLTGRGWPRLAG